MPQQGFSLIELLMGLAIGAIVLSLIGPAFATLTESNRREQAAESLVSGIRNARTLAIARSENVVIHGINGDWSQGWRIVLDISGQGARDSDDPVLVERPSDARIAIVGNGSVRKYIRFSSLGEPLMPGRAFQAGTLHVCATGEAVSQLQVVLAASGRVRLSNHKVAQALCPGGKEITAGNARAAL